MRNFRWIGGVVLILLAVHATPADAVQLAFESFDYATGPLATQNGGSGWTSTWGAVSGGTISTTSPGATYPNLPDTGNKVTITPTSGSTISARAFTGTPVTSGTIYFSALFDKTNSGTRFFGMQILNGSTEQAFFGKNSANVNWSLSRPAPSLALPSSVSSTADDQALLVLRVDFNFFAGTFERLSLYVNPTAGDLEPAANVVSTQADAFQFTGITGISVGAGFNSSPQTTVTGTIDEIRIGTTWSDVVPEPTGLAVLFLGALVSLRQSHRTKGGR